MLEKGDGTAYFGNVRQSDVQSTTGAIAERHINTNSSFSAQEALFGMIGQGQRYNLVSIFGQTVSRWLTNLPTARAISFGGSNTSIVATADSYVLNEVATRLTSINQNT